MRVFIVGLRSSEQIRGSFRIGTHGDICCNRFVPPRPRINASKPPVPSRTSPLIVRDGAYVGRRSQVAVFVPNPSWRNAAPIIPCPVQFSAHFSRPHRSASVSKTFIGIYRADRAGDFVGEFVGVAPMAFVNEQVTVNVRSQFTRQRQRERDLVPKFSEASTCADLSQVTWITCTTMFRPEIARLRRILPMAIGGRTSKFTRGAQDVDSKAARPPAPSSPTPRSPPPARPAAWPPSGWP